MGCCSCSTVARLHHIYFPFCTWSTAGCRFRLPLCAPGNRVECRFSGSLFSPVSITKPTYASFPSTAVDKKHTRTLLAVALKWDLKRTISVAFAASHKRSPPRASVEPIWCISLLFYVFGCYLQYAFWLHASFTARKWIWRNVFETLFHGKKVQHTRLWPKVDGLLVGSLDTAHGIKGVSRAGSILGWYLCFGWNLIEFQRPQDHMASFVEVFERGIWVD